MRILMISSFLPYPLFSGGNIRLYSLIKNLSAHHQITLICEKRDNQSQEDIKEVEKICETVITVRRRKQWSMGNILKTGFSSNPFLITGHTSEEMRLLIQDELVRNPYDLIHVETFYVYQNLPEVKIPVVLVEHNIEYLVYERYAKLANRLIRPLLLLDVFKLKQKETKAWQTADKVVAVSNIEKRLMKMPSVDVVPNGVDTLNYDFRSFDQIQKEKRVLFIGDYKWMQNRDAVELIIKEIWPNLLDKFKEENKECELKLWIVGKNMPSYFRKFEDKDIIFDYNNKDTTADIFRKSYILLAPLRAAGGTSYKILEAMATGVAVVTTGLGVEGLEAKNGLHLLSSDSPTQLADFVFDLTQDHSLYKKLTINARRFVENTYDWRIIAKKLDEVYLSSL
jgi:glycosyltransferase involved in cell wall biosynthesis